MFPSNAPIEPQIAKVPLDFNKRSELRSCYERLPTLVLGATGFIGAHCSAALHGLKANLAGVSTSSTNQNLISNRLNMRAFHGDVCDRTFIHKMLLETRPEIIFHLAGLTPARTSHVPTMMHTNVEGTRALLDGVRAYTPQARTLIFSSSAVYGEGGASLIAEDAALNPLNDYGVCKVEQELTAIAFNSQHGTSVVRVRTFNLMGPGEPQGLVCSSIARQIAAAELGLTPPVLRVGNLHAHRDFTDVRDAVEAYLLIGAHGTSGDVYNVCSARTIQIGEVLENLLAHAQVKLEVIRREDAHAVGSRVHTLCGSYERLHNETGWEPRIRLDQSLRDLLDWWRVKLKCEVEALECV